ncbi:phenylalanine--tRNA ligase subunit beta [Campylobacter sp. faydin G-24]|uniref:Phenylalanine--tRNA ligase beta subunit n=1 Tax=Campylobacter anatolicus TaxID=2829105 RepID=A0ABS5HFT7_9BACT|nr:phenylalanine--tRNA ligase subunit beta [Campylobacter anatolicus]MBR8463065.1 phenylalanine--tRNA ligase subunit beta [Campylobacter anatolicus]
MIISKNWLNEWVELGETSGETLVKTLNSIGLEVDSYNKVSIPDSIVVGYVKSREKHPDADKLNICQVDVGSETLQIVCGAKNVEVGQFVPVALIGTTMPNGLEIKKAKLRGAESYGMICSSTELGLVKINDGIMSLDESIGQLKLGVSLNKFGVFSDDIIEVDITANRGDCQSLHGIAREICAALDLNMRENLPFEDAENLLGIGRLVSVRADEGLRGSFLYRAFEIKNKIYENLLTRLRLALIDSKSENAVDRLIDYVTYSTGVLFNTYDYTKLVGDNERVVFDIKKGKYGENIVSCNDKILSIAGIYKDDKFGIDEHSKIVIIEANYTEPAVIAQTTGEDKSIKKGEQVYRSSRGSEPNIAYGADYLFKRLSNLKDVSLYAGSQQAILRKDLFTFSIPLNELTCMIGQEIPRNEIVKILKKLGFEVGVNVEQESINIKVPAFRHDISNSHDVCEEIVRIVGIDNIASVPLNFAEQNRLTPTYLRYKNALNLRHRAANCGFFESVHYVFDNLDELTRLGFKPCKISILNPINNELNTLRPTLVNHLLNSCERNIKNSRKSVKLFELGEVFDENAVQSDRLGFVMSGLAYEPTLTNGSKGVEANFYEFASAVQNVVGKFELKKSENLNYLSPYEQAEIYQNGKKIGYIGRVDIRVESLRDLPKTYICEIEFDALKFETIKANIYSKFPSISRDLSLVVPNGFEFGKIYECIRRLNLKELKELVPVDIYRGAGLENAASISLKLTFQDMDKTLEDDEVVSLMDKILSVLKNELGIAIR